MKSVGSPRPVIAGLAGIAILSIMDAAIKGATGHHAITQVVLLRFAFGAAILAAYAIVTGAPWPTLETFRRAAVRAVFIYGTGMLFFTTLTLLPLVEAVAITFTSPFFMVIVSRVLLGEPLRARSMMAVLIGFLGVLVMLGGRLADLGGGDPFGYVTGLGASVTYAVAMILTRRHSGQDGVVSLVMAQNFAVILLALPAGALTWTALSQDSLLLFILAGFLGTVGHLILAWAYSNAPASRLAPLEYTAFLWAAGLGAFFFQEIPTLATIAGAGLIVAACFLVFGKGDGHA